MFKFMFVSLASLFVFSATVFAQSFGLDARIAEEKAKCMKGATPTDSVTVVLARKQCLLNVTIATLTAEQVESGTKNLKFENELKQLRASLEETKMKLKALESSPKVDAKKPSADVMPIMPAAAMPPAMTGVPFTVIETPGQLVAMTRDHPDLTSRYKILSLTQGATHFLNQKTVNARAVVLKNGRPLAVSDPSPECLRNQRLPGCFTEFFADLNHDGAPEQIPYKGIDPAFLDTVYVATEPGDMIQIVYLVPVGNRKVAIAGMPLQTLWGYPVRVKLHTVERMGRYQISVFSGNEQ